MNNAPPPLDGRYGSGPVWCERRGRSAVVSLVTPVAEAGSGPYIQWCSLVGTDITCDQRCVCLGAKWAAGNTVVDGLNRETYDPLRGIVAQVRARIEPSASVRLESWLGWATAFVAGISSEARAWRAAEEARHAAIKLAHDVSSRRALLAAEDAAWAAVHAAAGNLALALQCTARARGLLDTAVPQGDPSGSA